MDAEMLQEELRHKRRQYRRALLETKRAIELELEAIDDASFEASSGLANICFELAKKNITLKTLEDLNYKPYKP